MSNIKTEVVEIRNVRPHPNADRLDIATINAWQVIVQRGQYKSGDIVVYFEQGTVLPEETIASLGILNYLAQKIDIDGNKVSVVHRINLRGEPSFGLVIPADSSMKLGDDVSELFGATKYFPPAKPTDGDAEADHGFFPRYTDIENMRSYPDVIAEGEQVVATEKIHGTNCRVGFVSMDREIVLMAGSRTLRRKRPATEQDMKSNIYWMPHTLTSVQNALSALADINGVYGAVAVVIYGEVYGKSIQSYEYGLKGTREFRVFDIMVDGEFMDYGEMIQFCIYHELSVAPLIYNGPFGMDIIRSISNGPSLVGGEDGREGVVVRPLKERSDPRIGRVILKYVGDEYLFGKKNEQDTTDL